jgi:hypothetical protein
MTSTRTAYILKIAIVDNLTCETTDFCQFCVLEDSRVECNAWVTFESGNTDILECCTHCLVKAVDTTPYLDTTVAIDVEVLRGATNRPF